MPGLRAWRRWSWRRVARPAWARTSCCSSWGASRSSGGRCGRPLAAGLDPVIVVLGHEAERVAGALAGLPLPDGVQPAITPQGVRTSLQAGVAGRREAAASALVVVLRRHALRDGGDDRDAWCGATGARRAAAARVVAATAR